MAFFFKRSKIIVYESTWINNCCLYLGPFKRDALPLIKITFQIGWSPNDNMAEPFSMIVSAEVLNSNYIYPSSYSTAIS